MASFRKPGPTGLPNVVLDPERGTLMRAFSYRPGTLGRPPAAEGRVRGSVPPGRTSNSNEGGGQTVGESAIVESLQARFSATSLDGVSYRIIRSARWAGFQQSGRYEVLEPDEARHVLRRFANQPGTSQAETSAFEKASDLLADIHLRSNSGLLLLRVVRVSRSGGRAAEPAVTPSQLTRLREPEKQEEVHWIGIELLYEDGSGVESARFVITTPDGKTIKGVTNTYGLAHVEGIESAGLCKIKFPDIDKDSWASA